MEELDITSSGRFAGGAPVAAATFNTVLFATVLAAIAGLRQVGLAIVLVTTAAGAARLVRRAVHRRADVTLLGDGRVRG